MRLRGSWNATTEPYDCNLELHLLDDNLDPTISPKESDSFEERATPMGKATINDFGEVYSSYAAGCLDPAFCLAGGNPGRLAPGRATRGRAR